MKKTNPEIMSDIWEIVNKVICNDNPYREIKSYYNQYIYSLLDDIKDYIDHDIKVALKMTIAANLIDFSAKEKISKKDIENVLLNARNMLLAVDDSEELFLKL